VIHSRFGVVMEEKRKLILESARRFFFRYGFKKTSMDDIAEDAGVGKGTLYNYFRNKVDLFICLGEQKQREMLEKISERVAGCDHPDEKLIRKNLCIIEDIREMIDRYAMSFSVLQELMTTGLNLLDHEEELVCDTMWILEEGEERGVFKPGDHRKTAILLNQISKTFLMRWVQMDLKDARVEIRDLFELIFSGLRTTGSRTH